MKVSHLQRRCPCPGGAPRETQRATGSPKVFARHPFGTYRGEQDSVGDLAGQADICWVSTKVIESRIHPLFPALGLAFNVFVVTIVQSISNAIWQLKVAPEVQGRVFSLRYMLATIITPLAYLTAGPLADRVFEPLMQEGGALANTVLGILLETGPGRGIGLIYVLSGVLVILISALAYVNPRIRRLEEEVPDAVPE